MWAVSHRPGQRREHLAIDFPRIGLTRHGIDRVEPHLAGDELIEAADLVVIAVKQGEEAGLRAGGPLGAAEAQRGQAVLQFVQVQDEIVAPEAGAFADGGQLGRLEVREAERLQVAVACGKAGQGVDDADQAVAQQTQPLAHQDQVSVVGDIAAGGAEVDDVARGRGGVAIGVDVGHHVVAQAVLVAGRPGEVDVVHVVRRAASCSGRMRGCGRRPPATRVRAAPRPGRPTGAARC